VEQALGIPERNRRCRERPEEKEEVAEALNHGYTFMKYRNALLLLDFDRRFILGEKLRAGWVGESNFLKEPIK
jgi:hypothetical protein